MVMTEGGFSKEDIISITATGYGRISLPFIDDKVTEITCHGRGAHVIDKDIRTIIDIGGQDSKAIRIDSNGRVLDFIMNDKCAAGTGRFLQVMSNVLEIDVSELSTLAETGKALKINSMCTVFAESEIISLLAEGCQKSDLAAGLLESVANRCLAMVGKVGIEDKVFFSGGVSRNEYLRRYLGENFKLAVTSSLLGQYNGALGAAVIGWEKRLKSMLGLQSLKINPSFKYFIN